ncbi:MAG: hypothetical protein OXM57_11355 [bacterium]|nr:hypothetical protein [bacterium]MDE0353274.1 hypothetical protein [bacterium]
MTLLDLTMAFYAAGSLLLVFAGVAKLLYPRPAADLMGAIGFPARVWFARAAGGAELVLGATALAAIGSGPALVAAGVYSLLAMVALLAVNRRLSSCGCFGQVDSPPSWIHVIGNLFFAAVCVLVAGAGSSPRVWIGSATDHLAGAVALALAVCVLAGMVLVSFTAVPEWLQARSAGGRSPETFRIEAAGLRR